MVMGWLAALQGAVAACPADPDAFDRVGRDLLFAEDLDGYDVAWGGFLADLPCLGDVAEPHVLARIYYTHAVYEYAAHGDWRPYVDAALTSWPELPRDLGAPELRAHPAPPPAPPGPPLPAGHQHWVDGVPVTTAVELADGIHVIQRRDPGGVLTTWVVDGAWPPPPVDATPPAPLPRPPRTGRPPALWLGAAGGLRFRDQETTPFTPWVPPIGAGSLAAGLVTAGVVGDRLAGGWLVAAGAGPTVDASGWVGTRAGPWSLGLGPTVVTAAWREVVGSVASPPSTEHRRILVAPRLHVGVDGGAWGLQAGGALAPALTAAGAQLWWTPLAGHVGPCLGADVVAARFEDPASTRLVTRRYSGTVGVAFHP